MQNFYIARHGMLNTAERFIFPPVHAGRTGRLLGSRMSGHSRTKQKAVLIFGFLLTETAKILTIEISTICIRRRPFL